MENDKFMLITIFLIVLSGVVCTAAVYATVNDSSSEINGSDNSSSVLENQTDNLTINNTTVENNTNISENGSATNVTTITVTMKPSVDTGLDYKSYKFLKFLLKIISLKIKLSIIIFKSFEK